VYTTATITLMAVLTDASFGILLIMAFLLASVVRYER
jgi:hypothetical protein